MEKALSTIIYVVRWRIIIVTLCDQWSLNKWFNGTWGPLPDTRCLFDVSSNKQYQLYVCALYSLKETRNINLCLFSVGFSNIELFKTLNAVIAGTILEMAKFFWILFSLWIMFILFWITYEFVEKCMSFLLLVIASNYEAVNHYISTKRVHTYGHSIHIMY